MVAGIPWLGQLGGLLIFGGTSSSSYTIPAVPPASLLNDLWVFDLSLHTWKEVAVYGEVPLARIGASMTTVATTVGAAVGWGLAGWGPAGWGPRWVRLGGAGPWVL